MSDWWGMWFVYRCPTDGRRDGLWPTLSGHWLSCTGCWRYLFSMIWLMYRIPLLHLSASLWRFCAGACLSKNILYKLPWASCQIRKIAGAHAPGMPGTLSPSPQVSDPAMHHGTCVTHVPWCMPGSLTSGFLWNRRRGETFPAFPAHAQPAILRTW